MVGHNGMGYVYSILSILYILCIYIYLFSMYILYVYIICIYYMYILYVCIICIYILYVYILYVYIICIYYIYYVYIYIICINIICIYYIYTYTHIRTYRLSSSMNMVDSPIYPPLGNGSKNWMPPSGVIKHSLKILSKWRFLVEQFTINGSFSIDHLPSGKLWKITILNG